jgi:putative hydrolase of the HAD superfamily
MTKPDLIIFDLGRVLVDFDFSKVVRGLKHHSPLTKKQIREYFVETPLWDAFERGAIEPGKFFLQLRRDLRLKKLTFKEFAPLWNDIFTEKHDTISVLRRLRGRYSLALLSNVNKMHWEHIVKNHDFITWFDYPIASWAVGQRKPGHDIFKTALSRAGVTPSRAIFFDDLMEHIHAARALGIRAHQFTNARQLIRDLDGILE